jgi:hypothetical protein
MKKYLLCILIVLGVIFVSGCIIDNKSDDGNTTEIQTISKEGILVKYPANWVVSKSSSNDSILSLSDSKSIDSSGIGQVNVNIERQKLEIPLDSFVNKTYTVLSMNSSFKLIYSGEINLHGNNVTEYFYTSEINGTLREHQAIWMENGGYVYVILCSAPQDKFESNKEIFNYIIDNFRIT